jgi:hypothetical protein
MKNLKLNRIRPGVHFTDTAESNLWVYRVRGKVGNLIFVDQLLSGTYYPKNEAHKFNENLVCVPSRLLKVK